MESTSGHRLQTADFIMFAVMLGVSVSIGIYYAVSGQKQRSTSEFLVGSRQMSFLPVAVSLIVSFQSSIMILGAPAEAYLYGMQFVVGTVGTMVVILLSARCMVPTFKSLNLTTAFEYLELRYQSRAVYVLGSLLAMVTNVWYMGIVLFGPAVALEAVTGFPQYQSIFLIAAVSVLYTSIGGIKAVVWTDVFQAFVMLVGLVSVSVKATIDGGGITEVWARAYNSGRINFFNFDPSLTVRHTFWNLVLSDMTSGLSAVYSQQTIQRVNSTRSLRDAQRIVLLLGPAFVVCVVVAAAEGVVAQSYFSHTECDPLKAKRITNPNQLIPYLVMEMFNQLPGMPGLFLATLFSASLSTLSSCLSSLSSQAWRDFLRPTFPNVSDAKGALLAKLSVVLFGLIGCGVAMMIARMSGPLTQILGSLVHAASAPTSGLFVLGCFFPWANAKGAIIGGLSSMAVVTWIGIGTSFSGVAKETPWLPLGSTQGCFPNNVTQSLTNVSSVTAITESLGEDVYGINVVYLLSYKWIPILGLIIVLLVGSLASLVTGGNKDRQVDQRYLVSFCDQMCCCLPGRILSFFRHKSLNHNTAKILGSLVHAASAPTSGLFVLGCFFPWANAKGAIIGGLSSMAVVTWIGIGTSFSGVAKETPWLPLGSTQGCFPNNVTQSLTNVSSVTAISESLGEDVYGINVVYLLSYKWIPILGLIIVLLVGSLASLVTGGNKDRQVDQRYLVSFCDQMCCCLPGRIFSFFRHESLNHNTAKGEEVLNEELDSRQDKLMSENTVL